ncbi:hypothetical protein UPYG_G00239470 [Umbra pygmaea]|uniref:Uncharacterized protein n=1 Tax=Umbra pygmaea TaxID=75934 RepID=A0ABD0X2U1_UMBPY
MMILWNLQGCKEDHLLLVNCLGTALGLCVILIIVLTCVLYMMSKSTGKSPLQNVPTVLSRNQDHEGDDLHYAALNVVHNKHKASRQSNALESETVYAAVINQNMN